jgi:Flp pilus assembly protein TadG
MIFGIIEFGRIFHAYLVITSSAREAARVIVVTTDDPSTPADETVVEAVKAIRNSAVSLNPTSVIPATVIEIQDKTKIPLDGTIWYAIVYNDPSGGTRTFGNPVGVYVKCRVDLLVPIIGSIIGNTQPIPPKGAKAIMRVEKVGN